MYRKPITVALNRIPVLKITTVNHDIFSEPTLFKKLETLEYSRNKFAIDFSTKVGLHELLHNMNYLPA